MNARHEIRKLLKSRRAGYSDGAWSAMTDAMREAAVLECAAHIVLAQAGDKYAPAQELIREILEAYRQETTPKP